MRFHHGLTTETTAIKSRWSWLSRRRATSSISEPPRPAPSEFSTAQQRTIDALHDGLSLRVAAKAGGVPPNILEAWLKEPRFHRACVLARRAALELTVTQLMEDLEHPPAAPKPVTQPPPPPKLARSKVTSRAFTKTTPRPVPPSKHPQREGSLTYPQALDAIRQASSPEAVAEATLAFAQYHWDRLVVLVHRGSALKPWRYSGLAPTSQSLPEISLLEPSLLRQVYETGRVTTASLHTAAPMDRLLAECLGAAPPAASLLYPLAIRGRTACILYAERQTHSHQPTDLAEFYCILEEAGAALEQLILANKS